MNATGFDRRRPRAGRTGPGHSPFLGRFFHNYWYALVWLAACAVATRWLLSSPHSDMSTAVRGIVESDSVSVAPVETARIRFLHVAPGRRVQAGDLLADMDTALIEHGVTADLIDIVRIETAFGDTHQDVLQAVSQRIDTTAQIKTDIATCLQEWRREEAELAALQALQKERDSMLERGIIDRLTHGELTPEIEALERAVALYPDRMATYSNQLAEAEQYYENMMAWLGAKPDEAISKAIQRRLNEDQISKLLAAAEVHAQSYRDSYRVKAPRDGVVSAIYQSEGDVALAGVPFMRIVSDSPERITAYLEETQAGHLRVGDQVIVHGSYRDRDGRLSAHAVVEEVSPEVHASAYQLTMTGRAVPFRSQRVYLRFDGPHSFIGGEAVWMTRSGQGFLNRMFPRLASAARHGVRNDGSVTGPIHASGDRKAGG